MTTVQHIEQAAASRDDRRFQSPAPSLAAHRPALRARVSHRGSIVGGRTPTVILYESKLEFDVAVSLLAQLEVSKLREQVKFTYVDMAGRRDCTHFFDFLVELADGRRILVAVKPHARAEATGLRALMRWIARQVPRSLADGIAILTERHVPKEMVRDAELIHSARRDGRGPADDAVIAAMGSSVGAVRVAELMATIGFGGQGFRAIVRRIGDGDLVLASPGPIGPRALVARPRGPVNHGPGFPGLTSPVSGRTCGGNTNQLNRGADQ